MASRTLRAEMCRIGRSLFERRYVHGTAGNLSLQVPVGEGGGFLLTPTDACLGFLQPSALAWIDGAGVQRSGGRPSKTRALHERIRAADPNAQCIVHTHSTHLVALTLQGPWSEQDILPPITPYFVMKVGHVPLMPYRRPGDPATAEAVAAAIERAMTSGKPLRAVMLDRLGPIVWGGGPVEAMATLEELEETARLWLTCQPRPRPLDEAQIEDLRRHLGARW